MKREYDFRDGKRGAVVTTPPGKTRITIRLDDDILEWFREQVHRAGGGNYQTLINHALREYMTGGRHKKRQEIGEVVTKAKETVMAETMKNKRLVSLLHIVMYVAIAIAVVFLFLLFHLNLLIF